MNLIAAQPDKTTLQDSDLPTMLMTVGGTHWTLPGAILEGLWSIGDHHLAATTDDVPYEDGLHLCLLSPKGEVTEEIQALSLYATGTFEFLGIDGSTLQFRFYDTPPWQLAIADQPQFRLPFAGLVKGTRRRPVALWSRLSVTEG